MRQKVLSNYYGKKKSKGGVIYDGKEKTTVALIVGAVLGIVICVGALASLSKSGLDYPQNL